LGDGHLNALSMYAFYVFSIDDRDGRLAKLIACIRGTQVTSLAEMLRSAVQKGEFARHGAKHAVSSSPLLLSNDIWCRLYHQCLDENLRDVVSM
jgi:hypothetical protein